MMRTYKILFFILGLFYLTAFDTIAQQPKSVSQMSKEEMMTLTYDDLLVMSFEDLITAANKFGMSADELLDFFLNKDVTSASKRAEKSINSPLSSTVLSQQEIENSGATCIPEVLRLVPGVIVREKTPGNYDVHIRGNDNLPPKGMFVYSENAITLVMIDGRPVYNYAFGGTFWETLPIELNDVERIEVIRGPSSALYGPNAVSGAISIYTKKVTENKLHVNGQAQMGNNNAKLANLALSKGITDKLKVRVSGNYTYLERFEDDYYVFDYNKKYTAKELETLTLPDGTPVEKYFNEAFENTSLATEKYGINAFLNYDLSKKVNFDLAVGTQQSEAVSNTLGNNDIPIIPRTSTSSYVDFKSSFYGFQFQANYMYGDQDYQKTYQGWHIKPQIFNSTLEYEYTLGKLVLRPGASYQTTTYDDSDYGNAELKDGFLNGAKTISSVAAFLRADYKLMDKWRVIGAIRADKYNKPDKLYPSFQFITSYDINPNNVVRAVYSRANRGPFVSDTYADYYWQIIPNFYTLQYEGNQELDLPTMDMVEIGYRSKLTKNIMLEVEAFHSEMSDIIFWTPDAFTLYADLSPLMLNQEPTVSKATGHGQYQNNDLKSIQNGITASVNVVINSKLNFKVFGTYQESKLTGFYSRTIWNDFAYLQASSQGQLMADVDKVMNGDFSPLADPTKEYASTINFRDYPTEDLDNDATPSFYGGAMVDYTPTPKWNINSSLYYYSSQTMLHNKIDEIGISMPENLLPNGQNDPLYKNDGKYTDMYNIDSKAILNLKVTYKFYKDHSVFVNARNLLNDKSREFAFLDEVNSQYFLGLNINF